MPLRSLLPALLLSACAASAATPAFLLGLNYTESLPNNVTQIATDSTGAIYLLITDQQDPPQTAAPSSVVKVSADGATVLWQNQLTFVVTTMAVDPNGGVYVIPSAANRLTSVVKLSASGAGLAWTAPLNMAFDSAPALAADSAGRAYVAGVQLDSVTNGEIIRLNSSGTAADFTTPLAGVPKSIAVDSTGAAYVAGFGGNNIFLARFAPDGSPGFFSSAPSPQEGPPSVALDSNGQAVVYASGSLQRYDAATGALIFNQTVSNWEFNSQALGLDSAGNAYIVGSTSFVYPVKNTIAPCGADMLSVIARDGSVLQTTYIPGSGDQPHTALLVPGTNSIVLIADFPGADFTASRSGPFPAKSDYLLMSLSPNPSAATLPLACVGNAASYAAGPVAPGEIVTLFGNGLGPAQGVQTQASLQQPFPVSAANVTVTFDGKPAPLLWVQDAQINAIAPWSLTIGVSTQICVTYVNTASHCLIASVARTSPGVFMADSSHAAAINQDGTINSARNPAKPGSIVSIFVTGLGPISPAQPDGTLVSTPLPSNVLPATVVTPIQSGGGNGPPPQGNTPLSVNYAGPAPDLVAGASQINFTVYPATLYVNVGSSVSQAFFIHIAGASE